MSPSYPTRVALLIAGALVCVALLACKRAPRRSGAGPVAGGAAAPAVSVKPRATDAERTRAQAVAKIRQSYPAHVTRMAPLLQNAVFLVPHRMQGAQLPRGASRFGGAPDLPRGVAWPRNGNTPMTFLAQLDLAQAAPFDVEHRLPPRGWLVLFYDEKASVSGFEPKDGAGYRLLFFEGAVSDLSPVQPPDAPAKPRGTCPLDYAAAWELPNPEDLASRGVGLDDEVGGDAGEGYLELASQVAGSRLEGKPIHHLLGHSENVQGDMKTVAEMITSGLPRAVARERGARDWRLLLQLDSDDGCPGWMWGDSGRLYLWIRQGDLAARRFDRAWLMMQCY